MIVQIFAVAVELPKKYMLKHWLSVVLLLLPVMIFGWLLSSVFIWKLVPSLAWIEALVISACVTATDPVLASAVVGKGKFARRVPGHLRNLLSAESGCNDGMAFPFAYLALLCIQYAGHTGEIAFHFIVITVLYECLFGTILGALIGYAGRHAIKFAESKNLIDRESFLVFYFVLALFCTGVGSIIGTDDLLVAFAAGSAFSWDGWFVLKTEESQVSNVIDLLLNMAFFVYFGAIIPWDLYNEASLGLSPWKLVIIAILLILFRRIPIMLALKPIIPDIRTWREALFCGHFGPIGVGAIFMSILARAELEHGEPTPLAQLPTEGQPHYIVVACIWPVVTFLIIASIIVHGSSIAVFTLGKRLNNLTITMTYTTNGSRSQSWLSRLPHIDSRVTSFSLSKADAAAASSAAAALALKDEPDENVFRPVTSAKPVKPAGGMKRRKKNKAHGLQRSTQDYDEPRIPVSIPIDLNANRRAERDCLQTSSVSCIDTPTCEPPMLKFKSVTKENAEGIQAYQEGSRVILEDSDGEVLDTVNTTTEGVQGDHKLEDLPSVDLSGATLSNVLERGRRNVLEPVSGLGNRIIAYQLDDNIIVENLEGEVIRRYRIASSGGDIEKTAKASPSSPKVGRGRSYSILTAGLHRTLSLVGLKRLASESQPHALPDLESQQDLISVLTTSTPSDGLDDEKIKRHIKRLLLNRKDNTTDMPPVKQEPLSHISSSEPAQPRRAPLRSPASVETSDDNVAAGDTETTDDSESEDDETEVEKQRRLAALGSGSSSSKTSTPKPAANSNDAQSDAEYLAERARTLLNAQTAQSASKPGPGNM